ncbi:MAG: adenylate/guanylate cyclase domain-containing protein [Candidatus Rifleibacteriota bacterium]
MQGSKTIDRVQKILAVFLVFLLLALPLKVLQVRLKQSMMDDQHNFDSEIAIRLSDEMSEFKKDLKPKNFLKKFLEKNLPGNVLDNEFKLFASQEKELAENQLSKINDLLKLQLYEKSKLFQPIFTIAVSGDLKNLRYTFSEKFLSVRKQRYFFENCDQEILARYILSFSLESIRGWHNCQHVNKHFRKIVKVLDCDLNESSKYFFRGVLSSFIKRDPKPGMVNTYFSDIFDFDNLLFYWQPFFYNGELTGVTVVGYLESHLCIDKILESATGLTISEDLVRADAEDFEKRAGLKESVVDEVLVRTDKGNLESRKLMVSAGSRASGLNEMMVRVLDYILLLIFFIAILSGAKVWFFDFSFPLRLRLKLMTIFALILFLPSIAGLMLYYGIARDLEQAEKSLTSDILEKQLNEIEAGFSEIVNRQVLNNLKFKSLLIENFEEDGLEKLDLAKLNGIFKYNVYQVYFYNRKGHEIFHLRNERRTKTDQIRRGNAVSALKNFGVLASNEKTRKDWEQYSLTLGFAESVSAAFDVSKAAGCEGENAPRISDLNAVSRSHFFVFPDRMSTYLQAETIGFLDVDLKGTFYRWVESDSRYPICFFSRKEKLVDIDVSIATRDAGQILESNWLNHSEKTDSELPALINQAMDMRDSGKSSDAGKNRYYSWRFYETMPIILTGTASFNDNSIQTLINEIFPLLMLLLVLLALFLISEAVSKMVLSPVQALNTAITTVQEFGDAAVEIRISNNDEFDQVGSSFNLMTRGLLQKKHISRFVSQRLVKALSDNENGCLDRESSIRNMTILTSDIRNFTAISESIDPEMVVEILNNYFTLMEKSILDSGGIIDKFIGDEIIAVFLPESCENPPVCAVNAAISMRNNLPGLKFENHPEVIIENGIGIVSDVGMVANIGRSSSRKDFTIVGELVLKAEKLEVMTKSGRFKKIMVDETTRSKIAGKFSVSEPIESENLTGYEIIERLNE